MKIMDEKFRNPFTGFIKKKKQRIVINEVNDLFEEKGREIIEFLKQAGEDLAKAWSEIEKEIEDVAQQVGLNTELVEMDYCSFGEMCRIIKEKRIPDSDQVVVVKDKYNSKQRYIISYMHNDEFITPSKNCFIIILTNGVDADIKSLFKESKIIKLK